MWTLTTETGAILEINPAMMEEIVVGYQNKKYKIIIEEMNE